MNFHTFGLEYIQDIFKKSIQLHEKLQFKNNSLHNQDKSLNYNFFNVALSCQKTVDINGEGAHK